MNKPVKIFLRVFLGFLAALFITAVGMFFYMNYQTSQALTQSANAPDTHIIGNKSGVITIVEFVDYRCHYCPIMNTTLMEALKTESDVKVIVRPVGWVDELSMPIAKFVLATARQGKMAELHKQLLSLNTVPDMATVMSISESLGIDKEAAQKLSETKDLEQEVWDNQSYALNVGFMGVPALIINGERYQPDEEGMKSVNALRILLSDIREKQEKK